MTMGASAVVSDIHGNSLALRAVLEDIARRGIETVHCLGDLVGYGPDPNGVIDLIRDRALPTIMGNYDDGVGWERGECGCFYPTPEAKRLGDASYSFTVQAVTPDRKAFLRGLPSARHLVIQGVTIHLVHGSPRKINEYLLRERDDRTFLRLAAAETDDVLVFGHTHDSWWRLVGGVLFVNVGSVGRPKDGDPRAMYTILTTGAGAEAGGRKVPGSGEAQRRQNDRPPLEVESIRVDYDFRATATMMEEVGLPTELAEAVRKGL